MTVTKALVKSALLEIYVPSVSRKKSASFVELVVAVYVKEKLEVTGTPLILKLIS